MSHTEQIVKLQSEEGIATITFNRPDKVNAFKIPDSRIAISEALKKAEEDEKVRVIVFKGAGRAFSSGWDLSATGEWGKYADQRIVGTRDTIKFFESIRKVRKPTIAMTHGYAVGAGLFLALSCDIVYSTEDCKFGTSEIRHNGPTYEAWTPWNVPRNVALEMSFTGDFIDGKKAESIGMINRTFPTYEALEKATTLLAKKICILDPFGIQINKYGMDLWYRMGDYAGVVDNVVNSMVIEMASEVSEKWSEIGKKYGFKEFLKRREAPFEELEKQSLA